MQRKSKFIWIAIVLFMASSGFVNGQTVNIVSGSPQAPGTSSFGLVLSDPSGGVNFNFQGAYDVYTGAINAGSTTYYTGFTTPYSYGGGDMNLGVSQGVAPTAAPGLYDFQLQKTNNGGGTWNCSSCFEISCPTPTSLSASSIATTTANLSWVGSVYATSHEIEYGPTGFSLGTGVMTTSGTNSTSISGLTPGTNYQFYVRTVCGPGDFSAWVSNSFSTAASCPAPLVLSTLLVTSSTATLAWVEAGSASSWEIEYGTQGFGLGNGTSIITGSNPHLVSGLSVQSNYQYYVRSICSVGDSSTWTGPFGFSTNQLLNVESGSPQLNSVSSFGLVISDPSAQNFFLAGSSTTYSATINDGSATYFNGFTDGYSYGGGNMSLNMSQGGGVPTAGLYNVSLVKNGNGNSWSCVDCFEFFSPAPNDACSGAISIAVADDTTIVANGLTQDGPDANCSSSSGADDDAWYVFVGTGTPVEIHGSVQGGSADFVLEVWDGCPSSGGTLVGCDDDSNNPPFGLMPLIQMCTEAGSQYYLRIFAWNTTATLGTDQMGLTVKEVRPVITGNSNVSNHGMTINFTGSQDGEAQVIRYHMFGDSPNFSWKNLPSGAQSGYVNGLQPNTRYTFRAGTRCAGENATYGDTATFWTRPITCPTPIASNTVLGNSAILSWNLTGANYYKIRYRLNGGAWSYDHRGQPFLELENLVLGNYEWQVRSICLDGGNQSYSPLDSFTIAPERLASVESDIGFDFNLYPNPTNGLVTIDFASEVNEKITFSLTDLSGKTVMRKSFSSQKGANKVSFELGDFESGIYLSTLSNSKGISEQVRVVLK
jgi:hypothetical protein